MRPKKFFCRQCGRYHFSDQYPYQGTHMPKRAVAQIKVVKPIQHPQTHAVVGQQERAELRVFETDCHDLSDVLAWCEANGVDSVGISFETKPPENQRPPHRQLDTEAPAH